MKSLVFFLSIALVFSSFTPVFAHESESGFYTIDPGQEDGVLSDFVADLKAGKVEGLKDIGIRASSNSRIALRVAEQIMANTSARVIHCLACREKNPDLKRIAKLSGIQNFLEIEYEGTKEHQELKLKITRVSDQKEVWSADYYHDQQEMRETRVEVDAKRSFAVFTLGTIMPKENVSNMGAFGLGFRARNREGWGLELDAERTTQGGSSFHLFAIETWEFRSRGEFWLAAGGTYLVGGNTTTNFNWAFRAGFDWNFPRQLIFGLFIGGRPASPFSGVEAGYRVGYAF